MSANKNFRRYVFVIKSAKMDRFVKKILIEKDVK